MICQSFLVAGDSSGKGDKLLDGEELSDFTEISLELRLLVLDLELLLFYDDDGLEELELLEGGVSGLYIMGMLSLTFFCGFGFLGFYLGFGGGLGLYCKIIG